MAGLACSATQPCAVPCNCHMCQAAFPAVRLPHHACPCCTAVLQVTKVEEEEYCLIPMGGVLPVHPQRVLGIGGTAGMVHPSTGFMMSRMLGAVPTVADAIIDQLSKPADKASATGEIFTRIHCMHA